MYTPSTHLKNVSIFLRNSIMNKIELTREEAMLVMRLLNLFLSKAQVLNVRDNSDVAPAKALKQNIFNQFMKLDTEEAKNESE